MSRSRKKHPIVGITTSKSEKHDKVTMHRKIRARLRKIMSGSTEEIMEALWPKDDEIMDKWSMAKDGKQYIHKDSPYYKKAKRK